LEIGAMKDRKKPGVAFWATVGLVAIPVLYVLSAGPACWLATRDLEPEWLGETDRFYQPILWILNYAPGPIPKYYFRYLDLWR